MIKQIQTISDSALSLLSRSWRGKKMLSYWKAYGGSYDFCRFFYLEYETGTGYMLLINNTLLICTEQALPADELILFIQMHLPFRIECPAFLLEPLSKISNYQKLRRTMFELVPSALPDDFQETDVNFNPHLDDVYAILKEGFPNLLDYAIWLTDLSHRCRHGISHVLTYKNSTTVTILFDQNNDVLVGQVATKRSARGSGYARTFLQWLAAWLQGFGKRAVLYALDIRTSFYQEIGFQELEQEYVLERKDVEKDNVEKGALQ